MKLPHAPLFSFPKGIRSITGAIMAERIPFGNEKKDDVFGKNRGEMKLPHTPLFSFPKGICSITRAIMAERIPSGMKKKAKRK
ncbi:MAG: hypothetical protein HY842_02440 [Bacteroidetes bacterium]|nr:hypothetical protein [Bacteroidota bacterium]